MFDELAESIQEYLPHDEKNYFVVFLDDTSMTVFRIPHNVTEKIYRVERKVDTLEVTTVFLIMLAKMCCEFIKKEIVSA